MPSSSYNTRACAHRGDSYCAPENTLPAFELALAKGAAQVEFDVRATRDGELVVIHDRTVDRTTDGTGEVSALTLSELRSLDAGAWKDPHYAGTRIPLLAEVLSLMRPGVLVNCQLYVGPEHVEQVIGRIRAHGLLGQAFLACGAAQMTEARRVEPRLRVCNLEGQRGPDSDYPQRVIASGAQFIQLCGWADCMADVVKELHDHGITVNFFGTEDPVLMRRLIEAGVDYVLTDHLDLMHAVMQEYGIAPTPVG
ncbi:MAG: glycerophosphodiester phosphodiesterase [Armatimonadetes bacterium]|nr:glycerophosphodiester phosphodiesterase [Armatimonadota bacterium]